jgi:uncharacterized protein YggE
VNAVIPPGIVATGEATVRVKPDGVIVTAGTVVQAATANEAQTGLSERVAKLLERAKALAIADGDMRSVGYRIDPQYAYEQRKAPRLTGFQATQQIALTIHGTDGVGKVLDALVQADGANMANVAFTLLDAKNAQANAREQAIQDALAKAKAMAKTAGVQLGRVISVSDVGLTPIVDGNIYAAMSRTTLSEAPQPQLPTGELEVVVRVQLQFEIVP